MTKQHEYEIDIQWVGNLGQGTGGYRAYSRNHEIRAAGVPPIPGSSDPSFRGDATRWNPEQLLLASVAQCHMLWYLGLAAAAGVVVVDYSDNPTGTMVEESGGEGQFTEVTLKPVVTIDDPGQTKLAEHLHHQVGEKCFIARSVNFPIRHNVTIRHANVDVSSPSPSPLT